MNRGFVLRVLRALTVGLSLLLLLSACLPAPAAQTSEVSKTSEVLTPTPVPPTETPTPTPIPTYTVEQLKAMTPEQKLALAPDGSEAPSDVLASYLPAGAEASSITWGERTLTFWDRVVAYHGQTADGQSVTMYYDLESGQWAKTYASFEDVAQIPAEEVPDVMVLTDAVMGDDRLIRAKLQYDYDWISQPQVMIDGKKVFRDEKGYPKAVFDTVSKKWLTPEEADVVFTLEKWQELFDVPFITGSGSESNYKIYFNKQRRDFLTDPSQIENLPKGTEIIILNPSGEITVWISKEEAIARLKESAVVIVGKGVDQHERNNQLGSFDWAAWNVAFHHYQNGNKTIYVTYGDVGVKEDEVTGWYTSDVYYYIEELLKVTETDKKTGRIVCPVIRAPKYLTYATDTKTITGKLKIKISDPDFWLDELIKAGAKMINIWKWEDEEVFH